MALAPIAHAVAQATPTATATASFDPNGNPATAEFFVEQKGGTTTAPTWTEVAKGPASPVVFTLSNPVAGSTVTFRIRARIPNVAGTASAPSNETSAVIPTNAPKNLTIIFAFPAP